jgi:hypothetical protein
MESSSPSLIMEILYCSRVLVHYIHFFTRPLPSKEGLVYKSCCEMWVRCESDFFGQERFRDQTKEHSRSFQIIWPREVSWPARRTFQKIPGHGQMFWKELVNKLFSYCTLYITLPPSIIPQVYKAKEHSRSFQIIVPREVSWPARKTF